VFLTRERSSLLSMTRSCLISVVREDHPGESNLA
jgi:hypothetical protein